MEKMNRYRLLDKTVKIENVGKWINDVTGTVEFETEKGIFVEDTEFGETVFIPWSSIAVLKILND
jgi:hypothetical protein